MQLTTQQEKGQELVNSLISKSWEDSEFKDQLIQNPISTIEQFAGHKIDLPEGMSVKVNDLTNTDYTYVIIPAKPNVDELELSDEQLEEVSGGASPFLVFAAYVTVGYLIGDNIIFNDR